MYGIFFSTSHFHGPTFWGAGVLWVAYMWYYLIQVVQPFGKGESRKGRREDKTNSSLCWFEPDSYTVTIALKIDLFSSFVSLQKNIKTYLEVSSCRFCKLLEIIDEHAILDRNRNTVRGKYLDSAVEKIKLWLNMLTVVEEALSFHRICVLMLIQIFVK